MDMSRISLNGISPNLSYCQVISILRYKGQSMHFANDAHNKNNFILIDGVPTLKYPFIDSQMFILSLH